METKVLAKVCQN